jgi:hypothetical protein
LRRSAAPLASDAWLTKLNEPRASAPPKLPNIGR